MKSDLFKIHFSAKKRGCALESILLVSWLLAMGMVDVGRARNVDIIDFSEVTPRGETLSEFWHGTGIDHNGIVYVAIGNGKERSGLPGDVLIFSYDTKSGEKRFLNSVRQILREEKNLGPNEHWPHAEGVAKVHSDIFEHNGKMYFSTHDHHSLENIEKHRGGHFISYDLATGKFNDLSKNDSRGISIVHEGIIAMNILREEDKLVGWTFPNGNVLLHDLNTGRTTKYGRGLPENQRSNVGRVVIATNQGDVFAAYAYGAAPDYLFKLDRKAGRLVPTDSRFSNGFFVGMAVASGGKTIYLANTIGLLYRFNVRAEKLEDLGSILTKERVARGETVRRLGNLTLSRDERKLFTIPRTTSSGDGALHLYEYEIQSGKKTELGDLSSVLRGSNSSGNGLMDGSGYMYLPFSIRSNRANENRSSGLVRIDVRDRVRASIVP